MGNTILAHALYSCNQIDLDLNNFFNSNGNAHNIAAYNKTNLTAGHLIEYPDNSLTCILQVKCSDWSELLRIKMSYSKWFCDVPTFKNYKKFNFLCLSSYKTDEIRLWDEFYQAFKDPSWPECPTPTDVAHLPKLIQQEIANNYQLPKKITLHDSKMFVEWLTMTYYDSFNKQLVVDFKDVTVLDLTDYIGNNLKNLINSCSVNLKWQWDSDRSREFHKRMIDVNQEYLNWLEEIKIAVNSVINHDNIKTTFDLWEQALILAKCCQILDLNPRALKWTTDSCSFDKNNIYLKQFLRTNYGQTI
jgi:hypothetical protein